MGAAHHPVILRSPRSGRLEGRSPCPQSGRWPLADDGDALAVAGMREVVPDGVVLSAAVVPEYQRVGRPAHPALELQVRLHVPPEELQEPVAFLAVELVDAGGEAAVDEEGEPAVAWVADDHGMARLRPAAGRRGLAVAAGVGLGAVMGGGQGL